MEMTYTLSYNALVYQMLADTFHQLHLLLGCQTRNHCLDHTPQTGFIYGNEAMEVHICKKTHNELAVHSVGNATMPGMLSPKSLMLKVRLRPEAKNPPNGAMRDAKVPKTSM